MLRKSTHRLGYRVLESKPATTAARLGCGSPHLPASKKEQSLWAQVKMPSKLFWHCRSSLKTGLKSEETILKVHKESDSSYCKTMDILSSESKKVEELAFPGSATPKYTTANRQALSPNFLT